MAAPYRPYRLRALHWLTRMGLSFLVLVLAGGLVSSALYMHDHYEGRDGVEEISVNDIKAAYHGVHSPSLLIRVLEEGHEDPSIDEAIPSEEIDALLEWLKGDSSQLGPQYDNFDLGDMAPVEIIARNCETCHSQAAIEAGGPDHGTDLSLTYWEDIDAIAHSRDVAPSDATVVLASLHTHSISIGVMTIIIVLLAVGTSWPRWMVGFLTFIAGVGLIADFGSWFLARENEMFVWGIIGGGTAFTVADSLLLAMIFIDLWIPGSGLSKEAEVAPA